LIPVANQNCTQKVYAGICPVLETTSLKTQQITLKKTNTLFHRESKYGKEKYTEKVANAFNL